MFWTTCVLVEVFVGFLGVFLWLAYRAPDDELG